MLLIIDVLHKGYQTSPSYPSDKIRIQLKKNTEFWWTDVLTRETRT